MVSLASLPEARRLVVAFSGGLDSVVLLDSLHSLRFLHSPHSQHSPHSLHFQQQQQPRTKQSLLACHVNHHINPQADRWQQFCVDFCAERKIDLEIMDVQIDTTVAAGLEERARDARYQAFSQLLQVDDLLLMAHHLDDQLETLLLRLSRGAGPRGLAGMPSYRSLGQGHLGRPLLAWPRPALRAYADSRGLSWVDDDSNADLRFDRNFIRHWVLPAIGQRWPEYRESWQKSQQLCGEAEHLLGVLAEQDLATVATDRSTVIKLTKVLEWEPARRRNTLRHWLASLGVADPGWNMLNRLSQEVITAAQDAEGSLRWRDLHLQRYREHLYALRNEVPPPLSEVQWQPSLQNTSLALDQNGSLFCISPKLQSLANAEQAENAKKSEKALLPLCLDASLTVSYRRGGERCRLAGRPEKTVKRLLQEAGVPPWLRDRYPLLYRDDELVCLPGIGVAANHMATDGEGFTVDWSPPELSYKPSTAWQLD